MMDRKIGAPIFLLLLLAFSIAGFTQNRISGVIKNLPPGKIQLVLEEDINRKKSRLIADIPIDKKGRFYYAALLAPNIYSLRINDNLALTLVLGKKDQVFIEGDRFGKMPWKVRGSKDTKLLMDYEAFRKSSLDRWVNSVRSKIRALEQQGVSERDSALLQLTTLEVVNYERHRDELIDYVLSRMGTSLAIYPTTIRWGGEKNIGALSQLAKEFERAYPNTSIAAKITEKVAVLSRTSIGGKAANIKMPDRSGAMVQLSSVRAKYILIDFWASWCVPCRKESFLLNEVYNKYKGAGFEIYGVSMDTDKVRWLQALEKDRRSWNEVSSLQGFETPAAFDYAVTSLPANIIIDATGKVIARNLHSDELKNFIKTLF